MQRASGMTLLEVLIALAIFSLAALALLQSLGQLANGTGRLEEKAWADGVAENQLVELTLLNVWPPLRWTVGKSEQGGQTWYWRWRGVESGLQGLRMLEVEVSPTPWAHGGKAVTTLQTWVAYP
ncbi:MULTISPECIES: type II secretion system minor pseudopilin GspI [Tenebrionibacter/Tenebrionicola group]|jgi:general secretion pathway protein I|uniref:Type II secretion system protein I n=2 Tax=Tenebrionibacter/Tenebrionicola group TaxID=2969848 RepID=A0A8K0XX15_9ENTR|nr:MULTISPECIES: type II secretion system minor pseudopilin GspI [Tenebrionibacter/Tenebrionicola group]MBK4716100.1 type II secretion system minor pseudopilin GspI [Tenebrionibacter intestinalis]MBV4413169.1 type II secretion system minor pseudopilin GspI [Tenebrionicola larvae]MBV5095971.1 type II secretion system minor pseudopilin GspI [Tenebrionicola larvae]